MYLQKEEQEGLAKFIKQCELDQKNLGSYQKAYEVCATKNQLTPEWWQTTPGVAGISVAAFVLGILAGGAGR